MSEEHNETGTENNKVKIDKSKKYKLILDIILIAAFLAITAYVTVKYGLQLTKLAQNPDEFKELLNSYGWKGILVFMGIQVLQVVVAAIPGEFVQIAGGYIYGTWMGTFYSLAGIVTGSVLVFFVARFLGYRLVKLVVSPEHLAKLNFMINSRKSETAMFILFLIPGMPKDILTYISGITPLKPLRFFSIIMLARFPALLASSYIGSNTQKGNYGIAIALSAAALILFTAGVLLKDKILKRIHKIS